MPPKNPVNWMLSEAIESLARAERMHQQLFSLQPTAERRGILVISGHRILPAELHDARIHRLELPQGRFERRIALPAGRYGVSRFATNGCVVFRLSKSV